MFLVSLDNIKSSFYLKKELLALFAYHRLTAFVNHVDLNIRIIKFYL